MVTIEEALRIIYENTAVLSTEKVDLLSSLNRVLAEEIYAKDNLPPFDKSAMDGYAVRSEDTIECTKESPASLLVKGTVRAGQWCDEKVETGEAFKIMTGAPVPTGADCVIEIEKVNEQDGKVYIYDKVKKENHIIKLGEEIRAGEIALKKGTLIRAAEIGLLASLGYSFVEVYKAPVVGLITTGDELVDIGCSIEKGKIRNSNEYAITAMIKKLGAEVKSFGIIADEKEALKEVVLKALQQTDIIVTSGGASVGEYDFVETVLKEIGADIKFNAVAIKPGKPISFATYKEKLFFSLPGNPLSAITTFEQCIEPACKKMMGKEEFFKEEIPVILTEDFRFKKGRVKYIYVRIKKENHKYYGYKVGSQSSNQLMTICKSNGIIIVPEDVTEIKAGECVNGRFIFN